MFQAGFHIHDHHIISVNHKVIDPFKHHMFRADASASACFHSSKDKQFYAITGFSIGIRNIVYLWVQFIKLILAVGSGTFFYQLTHLGDWNNGIQCFFVKSKGKTQVRIRIHIRRKDLFPSSAYNLASVAAKVVFPTPPLPVTAIFILRLPPFITF